MRDKRKRDLFKRPLTMADADFCGGRQCKKHVNGSRKHAVDFGDEPTETKVSRAGNVQAMREQALLFQSGPERSSRFVCKVQETLPAAAE